MAPVYEARVIWWLVFLCMAVFPQQFYCTPQVLSTRSTKIVPNANVAAVNILAGRFSDFDKHRLEGYKFIHLETNATWELEQGGTKQLLLPVGSNITLFFPTQDIYHSMQSATSTVPQGGLTTPLNQIVLQVPMKATYDAIYAVSPGKKDTTKCSVVVTVCNVNKTVEDKPQGLLGAKAFVHPPLQTDTFYFGTWFDNSTDPFPNGLNSSSWDGGVLFLNLPTGRDYVVTAAYPGYNFTTTTIRCITPGSFINGAPNQGPRAYPTA